MKGAIIKNVLQEVVYVKAVHKIDRIYHKFAGKKRNWLLRQIDPTKRYMHML